MNDQILDAPAEIVSDDTEDFAAQREQQVARFVKTSPGYYRDQFARIGSDSKFVWTTNLWAGILGPIWFSARGMWNWGLAFLILETMAAVQIGILSAAVKVILGQQTIGSIISVNCRLRL